MDKKPITNLSQTLNVTAFCRSVYNFLTCIPSVDVAAWKADPRRKAAPEADVSQWDMINAVWEAEYSKYTNGDDERMNAVMCNLWDALHRLVEADYETARDAARGVSKDDETTPLTACETPEQGSIT